MPATAEDRRIAEDPSTAPATLAELARTHPDLHVVIARNPACYDGLREWILSHADSGTRDAILGTAAAVQAPAVPGSVPAAEPSLPLASLGMLGLAAVLAYLVVYPLGMALTDGLDYVVANLLWFVLELLPLALAAGAVLVLPMPAPTRRAALIVAGIPIVALVARLITELTYGIGILWGVFALVVMLAPVFVVAAWLVARSRPAVSFLLLPVLVAPMIIARTVLEATHHWQYFDEWFSSFYYAVALEPINILEGILIVALGVGIVWLARAIATRRQTPRVAPAATASPGAPAAPTSDRTNTMALVALILGIVSGPLAIIFGHIGLAQIGRTGERGRGFAIAGLVLGYASLVGVILVVVVWFAIVGRYLF